METYRYTRTGTHVQVNTYRHLFTGTHVQFARTGSHVHGQSWVAKWLDGRWRDRVQVGSFSDGRPRKQIKLNCLENEDFRIVNYFTFKYMNLC